MGNLNQIQIQVFAQCDVNFIEAGRESILPRWIRLKRFYHPNHPNQNHHVQEVLLYLPVEGGWVARPAVLCSDYGAAAVLEDNRGEEQLIFVADGMGVFAYRLISMGTRWARWCQFEQS